MQEKIGIFQVSKLLSRIFCAAPPSQMKYSMNYYLMEKPMSSHQISNFDELE